MFFYLEVQEIDKLKDISVFILVKEDPTLLQELEHKADIGKEPEEEDDLTYLNTLLIYSSSIFFIFKFLTDYWNCKVRSKMTANLFILCE